MRIVRTHKELGLDRTRSIGFVPTMGAFHEGHLSLMRKACEECDQVVASLFVNPLQFGLSEDLSKYPRREEEDAAMAEAVGVDVLFAPSVQEVYPRQTTVVSVSEVSEGYEGRLRPGHFDGVSTVVCKLFNMVQPTVAYFGLKDLQQCAVVSRMVEDLDMDVKLSLQPTIREASGLAMSSRNAYLTPDEKEIAPSLYEVLQALKEESQSTSFVDEEREIEEMLKKGAQTLEDSGFKVDYLDLVDPSSFRKLRTLAGPGAFIVAARLGSRRLIDNIILDIS